MTVAPDGDVLVTGRAFNDGYLDDMVVMRLDSGGGGILWLEHLDGGPHLNDRAYDILVTGAGDVAVTGVSVNFDESADFMTVLLDGDNGNTIWTERHPGAVNNENIAGWLGLAANDDIIMASRSWVSGNSFDVVLHRYAAADGDPVWQTSYDNGGGADDIRQMILDGEGHPIVVGVSSGDMMTLRFDPTDGGLLWDAFHDGPMGWFDVSNCAAQGPAGLILSAGFSDSGSSTWDATVVAHDATTGAEEWVLIWDGVDNLTDELKAITLGESGELYLTGYSYANGTDMDLLALAYNFTATGAPEHWNGARPLAAWPNPFTDRASLALSLPAAADYRAEIYDAQGRLVKRIGEGFAPAGDLSLAWDGRDDADRPVAAGVYLARVRAGDREFRGRLMRLR
jgi:hypothetical protein